MSGNEVRWGRSEEAMGEGGRGESEEGGVERGGWDNRRAWGGRGNYATYIIIIIAVFLNWLVCHMIWLVCHMISYFLLIPFLSLMRRFAVFRLSPFTSTPCWRTRSLKQGGTSSIS